MRYLSFDIECCDGKHICEFGYVISDERFNILKKEVLIIDPEEKFNFGWSAGQKRIKLYYQYKTYYAGKKFPFYYEKIKELLEFKDQIIVGHALNNDAWFLRTACEKYGLPLIWFDYFDSQKAYAEYSNEKGQISLENAGEAFKVEKPDFLHKSDDDALLTLQTLQKMCESLSVSLPELRKLCPGANGSSGEVNVLYTGSDLSEMLEALSRSTDSLTKPRKAQCLRQFAARVSPRGERIESKLNGRKLCFSSAFEKDHIREALVIVQLLADHGCRYVTKTSEIDYYAATEEELKLDTPIEQTRYHSVTQNRAKCRIISFKELYEMLSVTEEEVKTMPIPKVEKEELPQDTVISSGARGTTIGDELKAKGITL